MKYEAQCTTFAVLLYSTRTRLRIIEFNLSYLKASSRTLVTYGLCELPRTPPLSASQWIEVTHLVCATAYYEQVIGFDYGNFWEWEEFDPSRLLAVMAGFDAPWWVAGGWALDLWMERQTQPHQNVDIMILRGEQQKLYRSLSGGSCTMLLPTIGCCPYAPISGFIPRSTAYGCGGHAAPPGCASSS